MEMTTFKFDAFLSYTTQGDYHLARKVEAFLESFHKSFDKNNSFRALRICRDGSDFRRKNCQKACNIYQ